MGQSKKPETRMKTIARLRQAREVEVRAQERGHQATANIEDIDARIKFEEDMLGRDPRVVRVETTIQPMGPVTERVDSPV